MVLLNGLLTFMYWMDSQMRRDNKINISYPFSVSSILWQMSSLAWLLHKGTHKSVSRPDKCHYIDAWYVCRCPPVKSHIVNQSLCVYLFLASNAVDGKTSKAGPSVCLSYFCKHVICKTIYLFPLTNHPFFKYPSFVSRIDKPMKSLNP